MKDKFTVREEYLQLVFSNNTEHRETRDTLLGWNASWHHYGIFHRVANILCDECRFVKSDVPYDELVVKSYPSLWKDYRWGGNNIFRFEGHRYPTGFKFEFYYLKSRTGREDDLGVYDYDRFKHLINFERLVFQRAAKKIISSISSAGVDLEYEEYLPFGRKAVLNKIKELENFQGPSYQYDLYKDRMGSNAIDRDKKVIKNGELKYFRDYWSGRLLRGEVVHNINNMWWVILNETSARNIASHDLFDPTPEDFRVKRLVKDRAKPEERVRRKIGTKLFNELKAKGIKMTEEVTV
jgi:hypothetical protein